MKILILTSIYPPDIGGPATYLPILAEGLIKRGHQVRILTLGQSEENRRAVEVCPVYRIDRQQTIPARFMKVAGEILRLGRAGDLLFVNGFLPEVLAIRTALSVPIVAKVVGDVAWEKAVRSGRIFDDFDTFQRSRYGPVIEGWRFLRNLRLRRMDRIITPSGYLRRTILSWGGWDNRICVIPNAIPTSREIGESSERSSERKFNILYAGRLAIHKRVDQIMRALSDFPDITLTVLGEGPEEVRLRNMADRLGVSLRVRFRKPCSHDKMTQVLKSHHCLVLNSTYEGFPHIVLEAQSVGTPVLATATGGTRELVRHRETGWLIDVNDGVEGIVRGLGELFASAELRRRLARNGKTAAGKLSVEAMVTSTEAVFVKVVKNYRVLS